jgi:hypothetical protein
VTESNSILHSETRIYLLRWPCNITSWPLVLAAQKQNIIIKYTKVLFIKDSVYFSYTYLANIIGLSSKRLSISNEYT